MKPLETTRLLLRQRLHRTCRATALHSLRMHRRSGCLYRADDCDSAARHWSRRAARDLFIYAALTWTKRKAHRLTAFCI